MGPEKNYFYIFPFHFQANSPPPPLLAQPEVSIGSSCSGTLPIFRTMWSRSIWRGKRNRRTFSKTPLPILSRITCHRYMWGIWTLASGAHQRRVFSNRCIPAPYFSKRWNCCLIIILPVCTVYKSLNKDRNKLVIISKDSIVNYKCSLSYLPICMQSL